MDTFNFYIGNNQNAIDWWKDKEFVEELEFR
jgi:hypothetical protein